MFYLDKYQTVSIKSSRLALLIIGDFRFEYEYEIGYENDFSILVFRLHIIITHTHFTP